MDFTCCWRTNPCWPVDAAGETILLLLSLLMMIQQLLRRLMTTTLPNTDCVLYNVKTRKVKYGYRKTHIDQ